MVCYVTKTKELILINGRLASLWVSPFLLQVVAFVFFPTVKMGRGAEPFQNLEPLSKVSAC